MYAETSPAVDREAVDFGGYLFNLQSALSFKLLIVQTDADCTITHITDSSNKRGWYRRLVKQAAKLQLLSADEVKLWKPMFSKELKNVSGDLPAALVPSYERILSVHTIMQLSDGPEEILKKEALATSAEQADTDATTVQLELFTNISDEESKHRLVFNGKVTGIRRLPACP